MSLSARPLHQGVDVLHVPALSHHALEGVGRSELAAQTQDLRFHLLALDLSGHVPVNENVAHQVLPAVVHGRCRAVEHPGVRFAGLGDFLLEVAGAAMNQFARQFGQNGGPQARPDAFPEVTRRHLLELAFGGVEKLLVPLVRHLQAPAGIEHADGISGRVQHRLESAVAGFQLPVAGFELPLMFCQLPFDVPLTGEGQRDLLNLLP